MLDASKRRLYRSASFGRGADFAPMQAMRTSFRAKGQSFRQGEKRACVGGDIAERTERNNLRFLGIDEVEEMLEGETAFFGFDPFVDYPDEGVEAAWRGVRGTCDLIDAESERAHGFVTKETASSRSYFV